MKNKKNVAAIGIIGGTDGPAAVFGGGVELPLLWKIKNSIRQRVYRCKRKRAEKKITAGPAKKTSETKQNDTTVL